MTIMQAGERVSLQRNARGWIAVAAILGAISVVAGAFAAHGLDPVVDAKAISWLHTGSQYAALHALAVIAATAAAASGLVERRLAGAAMGLFVTGSVLFSGALYGLALHGPRWLGAVAPIGGTAFILGWIALAAASLTRRP